MEVVVTVALVAIVSLVVVEIFLSQNRLYKVQFSELNILNDARLSLDDIDSQVRSATRTVSTHGAYNAGPTVLILQIQSVNATDQLIPGTFDVVVYYLNGAKLFREILPDALSTRVAGTKLVADNVTSLNFVYNNADFTQVTEVETQITILEANNVQNRSITASSKSRLRNH